MIHPDQRIRPGPGSATADSLGMVDRTRPSMNEVARDMIDVMRTSPPEHYPGQSSFAGIADATTDLGLDQVQERVAHFMLDQIVDDTANMMDMARKGADAGIPAPAVRELLSRGMHLAYQAQQGKLVKGAAAPEGTRSVHGGRNVIKRGNKWVADRSDNEKPGPEKGTKKKPKAATAPAKTDSPKPEAKAEAKAEGPDPRGTPHSRLLDLQSKAAKHGKKLSAKNFDPKKLTHEHIDQLEHKLTEAIMKKDEKPEEAPAKEEAAPAESEAPAKDENLTDSGRPTGHDTPAQPHEQHRLAQEAHDLNAKLDEVKGRLDSPHTKGMHAELVKEGKQIAKDPSPQAVQWHKTRVLSFLALVTGVAAGAALGADVTGGAMAGGVQGKNTKVSEEPSVTLDAAKTAANKLTGKPKDDEAKKAVVITADGRLLIKAAGPTPPKGYTPIPNSKRGGFRKRQGSRYVYWYPDEDYHGDRTAAPEPGPDGKVKAAVKALRSQLTARNVAAKIWHGVVHTAKEFPAAAKGVGKLLDGEPLSRHEKEAIVSVGVMVGTAALAAASYGATAGAGALSKKFVTHVAMAALSSTLNTAYTGYAAVGFVGKVYDKLTYVSHYAKAEADVSDRDTGEMKQLVAGVMTEMARILGEHDWTADKIAAVEKNSGILMKAVVPPPPPPRRLRKSAIGLGRRAPHPKNVWGHRDGLEPGQVFLPRERHAHVGPVTVLDGGRFSVGGQIVKGGHALLSTIHGTDDHHQTVRRYFRLGGERAGVPDVDVTEPLNFLFKSRSSQAGTPYVSASRSGDSYLLVGDLVKAGVPEYLVEEGSTHRTTLDQSAAVALIRYLGREEP